MEIFIHTINGDPAEFFPNDRMVLNNVPDSGDTVRGCATLDEIRSEQEASAATCARLGINLHDYGYLKIEVGHE